MTTADVLVQLAALSNPKMLAHNIKWGAHSNQYGVKMGDLRTVANKIKLNHPLALDLWQTGNIDARLLALLIIKPKELSAQELDAMVRSIDFAQIADWFSSYVLKEHPAAESLREDWMNADNIWAARAGWSLTAGRIARKPEGLDVTALLDRLAAEMPEAAPEVQWTMNTTLAYIGIHFPEYRSRALSMGEQMGIYRDYPVSKGCTSPYAPIWINEMVSRQNAD